MNIKEESLKLALDASGCRELTKSFNENGLDFWLRAIGCVKKCNGSVSYCLLRHRYDGLVIYEKDFGAMSPINGLLSVHPYIFLDKNRYYFPLENMKHDAKLANIERELSVSKEELSSYDDEMIKNSLMRIAIMRQEKEEAMMQTQGFSESMLEDAVVTYNEKEDEAALRESRKNVMDEDGMITIVSALDHEDDDDENEFLIKKPKKEDEAESPVEETEVKTETMAESNTSAVTSTSKAKEYTSEGDLIVEVVTRIPKKRGRPRKNPQ